MVTKVEWESLKNRYKNKCAMCGASDTGGTLLEKAHLQARSKGGTQIIPLCPSCHAKYDKNLCNVAELKKIGVDPKDYNKVQPKKSQKKTNSDLKIAELTSIPEMKKLQKMKSDQLFGKNNLF